jgi:hypothetical protein
VLLPCERHPHEPQAAQHQSPPHSPLGAARQPPAGPLPFHATRGWGRAALNTKGPPSAAMRRAEPTDRCPARGQRIGGPRRRVAPPAGDPPCWPGGSPAARGRAGRSTVRAVIPSAAPISAWPCPERAAPAQHVAVAEGGEPLGAGVSLKPAVGHARLMASSAFLASYVQRGPLMARLARIPRDVNTWEA